LTKPDERSARADRFLGIAAEHATDRVPVAQADERVGVVRGRLAGERFECAEDIAVLDAGSLAGLVSIETLLAADADASMGSVMDPEPLAVVPGTDQRAVARRMDDHGQASVAVVGADGRFLGLIPPAQMVAVLHAEHERDLARIGGYRRGSRRARRAAEERVGRRLWHRLPWLLVGLAGAMLSVAIVGAFERQLEANVLLAFFLPAVIYMADAVGTQTEAVLIRGLSAGVTVRTVLRRELITGAILGALIGGAFVPFALIAFGDAEVALAVGVALFTSCAVATAVAIGLPAALQRLGRDPAFGSGPLATVVQDLLSILAYFGAATAIVG
jgi:magnesium transporter